MASRRAEPERSEEGVGEHITSSAHLGFLSQLDSPDLQGGVEGTPLAESCVDGAPSVADATATPGNDTPKSIDHGNFPLVYTLRNLPQVPQMYCMQTPLGAAVTSSGGPIQVLRMLFTRVLTHGLTPDGVSMDPPTVC